MGIFDFKKRVLKYIESYLLNLYHVSKNYIKCLYHIKSMLML